MTRDDKHPTETSEQAEFEIVYDEAGREEPPESDRRERAETPQKPPARDIPWEYLLVFVPTLLMLGWMLGPVGERLHTAMQFPYQLDIEEGFLFDQAVRLQMDRPIYTPIAEEPWLIGNYPPLVPWTLSLLRPLQYGLPMGRLVVAVASLLVAQLLLLLVYWRTRRLLPALLAPLLFVTTYEFYQWAAFFRVDLPALALSLLGLFLFIAIRPRWGAALAAVVFVAAGYARQTSIYAPLACAVSMLLFDRRRLLWFIVPYAALGAGGLFWLNELTNGEFWRHVVEYNKNVMDWTQLRLVLRNEIWFFHCWWIAAFGLGAVLLLYVSGLRPERDPEARTRFLDAPHAQGATGFYALFAALGLAAYAKIGSAPNYGLEPLAAMAVYSMEILGRLCDAGGGRRSWKRGAARLAVLAVGAALLVHAVRLTPTPLNVHRRLADKPWGAWATRLLPSPAVFPAMMSARNPDAHDRELGQAALKAMQQAEGRRIVTEYPIFSIMLGREVFFQPFIMSRLEAEGVWNPEPFHDLLRRRRVSLIVTSQDLAGALERGDHLWRYTEATARLIVEHYDLAIELKSERPGGVRMPYFIWLPKKGNNAEAAKLLADR